MKILLVSLAALLAAASPAAATVVYPTGEFPGDVQQVQAAVDAGGTVMLKAVNDAGVPTPFNFGPPVAHSSGVVFLERDVALVGEVIDGHPTTIRGGFIPLFGTAKSHTRVQGIHFVEPLLSAALFVQSVGVDFVENLVTGPVGLPLAFLGGATEGRAIKFLGNNDPAGALTGTIRLLRNRFEANHADLSDAIVFDSVAADVEIDGNVVGATKGSGVLMIAGRGDVKITRNAIVPGPDQGGPFSFGDGIFVVLSEGGSHEISGNDIHCENPNAAGILLQGEVAASSRIEHNVLGTVGTGFGALTVADTSRVLASQNRIRGSGSWALGVIAFFGADAVGNAFVGNDTSGFDAQLADVFLDFNSRGTIVVGRTGTVFDLGAGNRLTGLTRGAPAAAMGGALRELLPRGRR
jgi:hypothetical protein